jgi:hypothetical protein
LDSTLQQIIERKRFISLNRSWESVVPQIETKIDSILNNVYKEPLNTVIPDGSDPTSAQTLSDLRVKIIRHFTNTFGKEPPFTVLRLAEVLIDPKLLYSSSSKFLHALDTITSVSSSSVEFEGPSPSNGTTDAKESNDSPEVVPVTIGDDTQTILLTKIDWLTEEDIKEIESETYFMTPAFADGEEELETEEQKKRKVEQPEDVAESPEKKVKVEVEITVAESPAEDLSTDSISDSEDREKHQQDPNETLPEDKMFDEEPSKESVDRSKILHLEEIAQTNDTSDCHTNENDNDEANTTLPEDKMDIDGA